ncbi:hypothetical protein TVCOMph1_CDS0027 [Terrisporobacter phage TVCOM_ph1]
MIINHNVYSLASCLISATSLFIVAKYCLL